MNKIQGFYYVDVEGKVFECHLRGLLKKIDKKENCVVGDIVEISDENYITEIKPRKNLLLRPVVSNIDFLVIQFAVKNPVIDYERLNILLLHSFYQKIQPVIIINKIDLVNSDEQKEISNNLSYLKDINVPIFFISQEKNIGIIELEDFLKGKVSAFAGPSGVGKSSIINMLQDVKDLKTGATSERLKRGKHTTRDSNLMPMKIGGFIIDTPGFSSVEAPEVKNQSELENLFPEFLSKEKHCKFKNCIHINEPNCEIKNLVEQGKISEYRYNFYKKIYENLKSTRWNKYD
ncbi:MAG: ribosome small subunit-dependent GTPase A [Fusobacteriaceae bacterium]